MSKDDFEHQMDFILKQQAKFSADIEQLKETQKQQVANIDRLAASVQTLTENTTTMQSQIDSIITEMRDSFDKLILSNEVTRDFANQIAALTVQTS
jgi:chromosome segregation ATPase